MLPQEFTRDEDKAKYNLEKMNSITNQRKEAGWILLEGFLSLGRNWIKTSISKILRFFKSVFRKENCSINQDLLANPIYKETVFNEFTIKKRALSCLRLLLETIDLNADENKSLLK